MKQSSVRAILSFFDSPKRQAEEEEAKRRVSDEAKRNAAEEAAKRQAVLAEAKQMLAEEEEPRTQAGAVRGREGAAEDGGRRAEVWELLCGVQCSSHCVGHPLQGAHVLHKGGGCAPRAGRCPPRGWQQGRDQPTAHGTVDVVRRCESSYGGARGWDRRGCATWAPRSANRQGQEQHRHTEHGSHTRRDKGEYSRQGGGAQQGRRGNQNSGNREPEWRGWESVHMGYSDDKGDGLASQPRRYRVPGQPLLNRHQVGSVSRSPNGLFAQQEREPIRGRPAVRGKRTYGGRPAQRVEEQGTWPSHTETQRGRLWTTCGQRCVDSKNSQTTPATTSTSSIRQLLGAADAQTAHQLLGSVNAETTPAGAPAPAADRTQRPDAACEGKNG